MRNSKNFRMIWFVLFFLAAAAAMICAASAEAQTFGNKFERKYFYFYYWSYKANLDPDEITAPCDIDRPVLAGFNLRADLVTLAGFDGMTSVMPTAVVEIEACIARYKNQGWAPSRFGMEFSFGAGPFNNQHAPLSFGASIKYQMPVIERLDIGWYLKGDTRNNGTILGGPGARIFYGLMTGAFAELRPWYYAENIEPGGMYFTARLGLGVDKPVGKETETIIEFSLGMGYRFTDF